MSGRPEIRDLAEQIQRATGSEAVSRLQARWIGWFWGLAVAVALVMLWQQIAGWPLQRIWTIASPISQGTVTKFQIPREFRASEWDLAMVRVKAGGKMLPRYASTEALGDGKVSGFAVKGNTVYLHSNPGMELSMPVKVFLPWTAQWVWTAVIVAGVLIGTLFLSRVGNVFVCRSVRRIHHWVAGPGIPFVSLSLLGLVLVAALLVRVRGFSFPDWQNDAPTYFPSVFAVAAGGHPITSPDRPFGFSLIMGVLLRWTGDLRVIVAAHGVATMVAGIAIASIVWVSGTRLFQSPLLRAVCRLLAVLTLAAFTLNEAILEREWALLAEAWVTMYLGIQVALVWFLTSRRMPLWLALPAYALFCAAGLLAFFTRPNWGFALGLLPFPWLMVTIVHAETRGAVFKWLAAGMVTLCALAAAGFSFQSACSPSTGKAYLADRARALVCWNVPMIRKELKRRLESDVQDPNRAVLSEMAQVLDEELELAKVRGPGAYSSLNYDPDELYFRGMYSSALFRKLSIQQQTDLCTSLFKESLFRTPEMFLAKVGSEMRKFFIHPYDRPAIHLADVSAELEKSQKASRNGQIPEPYAARYQDTLARAVQEYSVPWPSFPRLALSLRSVLIFVVWSALFAWMVLLPMAICCMALVWKRWREAVPWDTIRPCLACAVWAFGSAFLSAMSAAVTQGLDVQRYIQLSVVLILLSQVLWPMIGMALITRLPVLRRGNT